MGDLPAEAARILALLRAGPGRLDEATIAQRLDLARTVVATSMWQLQLRGLTRVASSWMQKRGGGGHSVNLNPAHALWEATPDDEP